MIEIPLLKHQLKFIEDDHRFLALVAGYGAGKTFAFCVKAIQLAFLNVGCRGVLLEPTNVMAGDILIPEFTELLHHYDIPFTFRASPYPNFILHFDQGDSEILIRSAENYKRLVGLNLGWFGVDEADTIQKDIAWRMWRLLISRLRDPNAVQPQGFTTSTPEGYSFLYEYFVRDVDKAIQDGKNVDDRNIINASSYDNPYLDANFIPSLLNNYPPELITGYLEGRFTNLLSGNVYHSFDRRSNCTTKVLEDFDEKFTGRDGKTQIKHCDIHIGVDFNVNKTCGIVHVLDGGNAYAVDEITKQKDTATLVNTIQHKYPNRTIYIYPDASGKNEKTNARVTDIQLLKVFRVKARTKNPFVVDRINVMNTMFLNGSGTRRYFVNINKCPAFVEALETQGYGTDGKPDKMHDQDHPVDAAGYLIYYMFYKPRMAPVRIAA